MAVYNEGQAEILEIWNGTDAYEPVVCLTSHSFNDSVDEISGRTKCDLNGAVQKKAGAVSYEISFEGSYSTPESGKIGWAELRTKLRSRGNFDWRITTTYSDATTDIEYGNAYFSNLEKTAANDEFITFSGSLMGNGLPSSTDPNA